MTAMRRCGKRSQPPRQSWTDNDMASAPQCPLVFNLSHLIMLACLALTGAAQALPAFDPGVTDIELSVNGEPVRRVISMRSLLPGEQLTFQLKGNADSEYQISQSERNLPLISGQVHWVAPATAGYYPFVVKRLRDLANIQIAVFVMQPADKIRNGRLNGFRIDAYPPPLRGLDTYRAPRGFIEVTAITGSVPVSPHFRLEQFLCKQDGGYPKYIVLQHKLLEKLELLLEDINERGIRADSLFVMSGYRTPYYNRAIGNVANSRHIYGGAADVFVDVNPVNNFIDDLNGDGRTNLRDADWLYNISDSLAGRHKRKDLSGGVGLYDKTPTHGPFVHVDVRGTVARWGR